MRVFVAGGTGTLGLPLVRALVAQGHEVTALTRSGSRRQEIEAAGARLAVADALDASALLAAVQAARPTHVIHELTAIPKGGVRRAADLEATNRLRIDGTRNLLNAAVTAGVRRLVVGSFAPFSSGRAGFAHAASTAVQSMETQVVDAARTGAIEGIVLRYGLFYGWEAPSTNAMVEMVRRRRLPVARDDGGQLPVIHVADAVQATVLALDRGCSGASYDIVDDHAVSMADIVNGLAHYTRSAPPMRVPAWLPRLVAPYMARIMALRLPLSNAAAKRELGWRPMYPTMQDGLRAMFEKVA
jgi:nucleoside-diphosphate-sugar epimerase